MVSNVPPFIANSTLPQWLIAVFSGGTFAAVLGFIIKWRGQTLNSDDQIRRLMAEELDRVRKSYSEEAERLRESYNAEVKRLTDKLDKKDEAFERVEKHWRDMLDSSDRRHEECEEARRELRDELEEMHVEIRGLKVQIVEASAGKVVLLEGNGGHPKPSEVAPHSLAAAKRLKAASDEGNGK